MRRLRKQTGQKAFYYGNFNRDHTQWTSYPAEGRYGTTYVGLRNRLSILSEAYSHAPFQDASAGHARFRARLSAHGREPQGRDREAAGPGEAGCGARPSGRRRISNRCRCRFAREPRRPRNRRPCSVLSSATKTAAGSRPTPRKTTRVQLMNEFEGTESVDSTVRVPDSRRRAARRSRPCNGTDSRFRSCARTSSSTSRSTRSTRSRSRRGGSRGTTWWS